MKRARITTRSGAQAHGGGRVGIVFIPALEKNWKGVSRAFHGLLYCPTWADMAPRVGGRAKVGER